MSEAAAVSAAAGAPTPEACVSAKKRRRARCRSGGCAGATAGCAGTAAACGGRRAISSVNLASSLVLINFSTPSISSANLLSISCTCQSSFVQIYHEAPVLSCSPNRAPPMAQNFVILTWLAETENTQKYGPTSTNG